MYGRSLTCSNSNPDGTPRVIAGVPPDYFSATGQCWGNPIYNWEKHAQTGFQWWIARFRRAFEMLDMIRLDHFRGFEAYYEIPGTEITAVNGAWVKGPGAALFEAVEASAGETADPRGKPGCHHTRGRRVAEPVWIPRYGDPAICIRKRSAGTRLQAAQLPEAPRGIHGHPR